MKEEITSIQYRNIIKQSLPSMTINSDFIKKYYGNMAQVKLGIKQISEFEDAMLMNGLAGIDCTNIDFSQLSQAEFELFPFDSTTIFSKETQEKFNPNHILEKGKSFGLGIEQIPLSGKNVHIAIIDENFDPFSLDINLAEYNNSNALENTDIEYMHGKTTTSLLASKSCGVAKDTQVHFFGLSGSPNGKIDSINQIIEYNNRCTNEEDKILIVSGSWALSPTDFEKYSNLLRNSGAELVCANNFAENFHEFISVGDSEIVPLQFSQLELEEIIAQYPIQADKIIQKGNSANNNVKIPINRTYHQVGDSEKFKYQASYSVSWGVPQVAGLFALFKELDRNLTFADFCDIARQTATGKNKIINPQGIHQELDRRQEKTDSSLVNQAPNNHLSLRQKLAIMLKKSTILIKIPLIETFVEKQLDVLSAKTDENPKTPNEASQAFENWVTRNGELKNISPQIPSNPNSQKSNETIEKSEPDQLSK